MNEQLEELKDLAWEFRAKQEQIEREYRRGDITIWDMSQTISDISYGYWLAALGIIERKEEVDGI